MNLQNIDFAQGSDNTAGIGQFIWYASIEDIETLPQPVVDNSIADGDLASLVTIGSNIIMKSGKVFRRIYVTIETGGITATGQGEFDGKSFINALEFTHPGNEATVMGFQQWSKNASLVFLVQEQDGNIRILGHRAYPAKAVDVSGTTGVKTADLKANMFKFQSVRKGPAPIFTGKVVLSPVGSTYDKNSDGFQDLFAA